MIAKCLPTNYSRSMLADIYSFIGKQHIKRTHLKIKFLQLYITFVGTKNTILSMKNFCFIIGLCLMYTTASAQVTQTTNSERTTFQTAEQWKPTTDIRADAVMCYGTGDGPGMTFEQRVKTWRDRGYTTHFMTGIAWGGYQDYFNGNWDGHKHLDEGQVALNNDSVGHGYMIPYIVPSLNYLNYFKEKQIKRVIDAGIDAIFLEEPEFWARSGYSDGFKREWRDYYGFDWRPQHLSAENTYLSNKLKYHLYYRALNEVFTYAKAYGREKGINVRCYVPTHSLLNYSQWQIVSPEASLASLKCVDGYIAQVWTGTARTHNFFNGKEKERVFETAFLEYGCMESMTRPTHRKVFFLTDPIEDQARDWQDYKKNYQATYTAEILFPQNNNYEVMPWPDRIYEGTYRMEANNNKEEHIPRFYSTQMQVMIHALNDIPLSTNRVSGSQGVSIMMANSLMFQRSPQAIGGYDDPQLSDFYGEALPLLKRGVPVSITHLENTAYPDTWKGIKVLLMTYSNMKPLDSHAHTDIANWVKHGGVLIYSSRDSDPFQSVQEWWNQGGNHFTGPSQHLFSLMNIPQDASAGRYKYGKGVVYVVRQDPKEFVLKAGGDNDLISLIRKAYEQDTKGGKLEFKNTFYLDRGPYAIISVLDENAVSNTPYIKRGMLIDLFDPELPVTTQKTVNPGEQAFLLDINRIKNKQHPQILASASRNYEEKITPSNYSFVAKSPINTTNVMRILLPAKPSAIEVYDAKGVAITYNASWDMKSKTQFLKFENNPEGIHVSLQWKKE